MVLPWRFRKISRLKKMREISLNVGSGGRGRSDWINFDAIGTHRDLYCTHDLRRSLPLATDSVRRIMAEHVIEHLDFYTDIPNVFAEFHRVLLPSGTLRIVVPDADRFMRTHLSGIPEGWKSLGFEGGIPADMESSIEMVNHVFHQKGEHLFAWDFNAMELALRKAGFTKVIRQEYGKCVDPKLAIDQPNHAPYSLYVDAVKV